MKKVLMFLFLAAAASAMVFPSTAPAGDHQAYQTRPSPMGVSISTTPSLPYIFAGTAGMRVRSLANPNVKFILSNNHVMGAIGPDLCPNSAPKGTWILQPGTLDIGNDPGNDPAYLVGIKMAHSPIDFTPGANNVLDAAVAYTTTAFTSNTILDLGAPTPAYLAAAPGMSVVKSGRTTGVTYGVVQSINTTTQISYEDCGTAKFVKQIVVTPGTFSAGGDSGSAVLEQNSMKPVGLLFAGSPSLAILNPILQVYLTFRVFAD